MTLWRKVLNDVLKLFDLALLILSFGMATLAILPHMARIGPPSLADFLSMRIKLQNFVVFFFLLGVWHAIFSLFGLYSSKRLASRKREVFDALKATTMSSAVLAFGTIVLGFRMVTPAFIVAFWALSSVLVASTRLALRTCLRRFRARGHNVRNMLIVGTNRRALDFAKTVQSRPDLGYCVLGFADIDWAGSEELKQNGYEVLSDLENLPQFIRHHVVDEVILALPIRTFHTDSAQLAELCQKQGIIVRVLSDIFDLDTGRMRRAEVGKTTFVVDYSHEGEGWPLTMKRVFDFTLSAILLILLGPLLLVTAILIKLTSPGPVFFVQKRVGYNKRSFYICKFRTMVADAEHKLRDIEHLNEVTGPVFKIKNDPRLTPIGGFLRRTSIDELPQLFNVLWGDMSLVGPRPLQVRDYDLFTKNGEDWQRRRFSVRPGITCLWQVNGRSSLPFEQWMELDLKYVQQWSLWLDFEILARTIPAVFKGSGAA
jgi:exopolysaccharide biosynthesis polyprenyl glycosylphosphotransferase